MHNLSATLEGLDIIKIVGDITSIVAFTAF